MASHPSIVDGPLVIQRTAIVTLCILRAQMYEVIITRYRSSHNHIRVVQSVLS